MTLRWPLEPLLEATGFTMHEVSLATGSDPWRYAKRGLEDDQADRWAIRCGIHPAMAWLDWVDAGLTVLDREYVEGGWRPAWLWNETHTATVVDLPGVELEEAA
jgi:hypothetical protein